MVEQEALAIDDLEFLLDIGDRQKLRMLLNELHPADLAEWFSQMEKPQRLSCFRLLDLDHASAVLSELDSDQQRDLLHAIGALGDLGIVPIISHMSPDDAVDLLAELPQEEARSIMNRMDDAEAREDLEELLSFKEDSAGGIMSTDYLALNAKMTVAEAILKLRETYEEVEEDIYDIYVVDNQEHLAGIITLKELLTASADTMVANIMDTNFIKVSTDVDQEKAAEKIRRYDLLTLPVVDSQGKLRGIITADDAFDVLEEETTEDIYQSSGIGITGHEQSETLTYNVPLSFKARLPWLVGTLLIETISASVITRFDEVIRQTIEAASFMPLLSGITGSVATQSTCIIIRGVSTSHINWRTARKNLIHELKVGMLLGLACGVLIWALNFIMHKNNFNLGIIVGVSLFITMTVGVTIGTLMPMLFHRMGIDPAHASGPLITSILDVSTVTIYLTIVHSLLSHVI